MQSEDTSSHRLAIAVRCSFGQLQWDLGRSIEQNPREDRTEASKIICMPQRSDDNVTVIVRYLHNPAGHPMISFRYPMNMVQTALLIRKNVSFSTPRNETADVKFHLTVELVDNFVTADGNWSREQTISASAPHIWVFNHHSGPQDVTVRVDSDDDRVCGLVSVQPLECPYADSVSSSRLYTGQALMFTVQVIHLDIKKSPLELDCGCSTFLNGQ